MHDDPIDKCSPPVAQKTLGLTVSGLLPEPEPTPITKTEPMLPHHPTLATPNVTHYAWVPLGPTEAERRDAGPKKNAQQRLEDWYSMLRELYAFKAEHGHCQYCLVIWASHACHISNKMLLVWI